MYAVHEPLLGADGEYLLLRSSALHSLCDFNMFIVIRSSKVYMATCIILLTYNHTCLCLRTSSFKSQGHKDTLLC